LQHLFYFIADVRTHFLAVFAGLTNVTNRHTQTQTDHFTPLVVIARILCSACDAV